MTDFTNSSRREFLAVLGGAAALLALGPAVLAAEPLNPGALRGADWAEIKRQFLLQKDITYFNCGSLGPTARPVLEESIKAWQRLEENPADIGYGPMLEEVERVRARAASFMGCAREEMILTANTTEGMNLLAQGLHLQKGQRVITTNHEHPGGSLCWDYLARKEGVLLDRVTLPVPPKSAGEILELFAQKITRDTRVISVSHVTFSTGLRMPIAGLAKLALATDTLLVVDGAQAPGALDVDLAALGCHAYATSAHKWLLAPPGTGLLYIRKDAQARIDPMALQAGYSAYTGATGLRNLPAMIGLGAAIDFLSAIGKTTIAARTVTLRNRLAAGIAGLPHLTVASPPPGELASQILTFALDGVDNSAFAAALKKKHGLIVKVVPNNLVNGIRISPHVYTTDADLDYLLAAIKQELAG